MVPLVLFGLLVPGDQGGPGIPCRLVHPYFQVVLDFQKTQECQADQLSYQGLQAVLGVLVAREDPAFP